MDVLIYNEMPKGWSVLNGALTAPEGFVWIWNGKSRFGDGKKFQHGLLKNLWQCGIRTKNMLR